VAARVGADLPAAVPQPPELLPGHAAELLFVRGTEPAVHALPGDGLLRFGVRGRHEYRGWDTELRQHRLALAQNRAERIVEGDGEDLAASPLPQCGGQGQRPVAAPEQQPKLPFEPPWRDREIGRPALADPVVAEDQEVIGPVDMPYASQPR